MSKWKSLGCVRRALGSITSRCLGKEPALLLLRLGQDSRERRKSRLGVRLSLTQRLKGHFSGGKNPLSVVNAGPALREERLSDPLDCAPALSGFPERTLLKERSSLCVAERGRVPGLWERIRFAAFAWHELTIRSQCAQRQRQFLTFQLNSLAPGFKIIRLHIFVSRPERSCKNSPLQEMNF